MCSLSKLRSLQTLSEALDGEHRTLNDGDTDAVLDIARELATEWNSQDFRQQVLGAKIQRIPNLLHRILLHEDDKLHIRVHLYEDRKAGRETSIHNHGASMICLCLAGVGYTHRIWEVDAEGDAAKEQHYLFKRMDDGSYARSGTLNQGRLEVTHRHDFPVGQPYFLSAKAFHSIVIPAQPNLCTLIVRDTPRRYQRSVALSPADCMLSPGQAVVDVSDPVVRDDVISRLGAGLVAFGLEGQAIKNSPHSRSEEWSPSYSAKRRTASTPSALPTTVDRASAARSSSQRVWGKRSANARGSERPAVLPFAPKQQEASQICF